jgi:hypothetical protein
MAMVDATRDLSAADRLEPRIGISPTITRNADGSVERQRPVVALDVIPEGSSYRIEVLTRIIPKAMVSDATVIENPQYNL